MIGNSGEVARTGMGGFFNRFAAGIVKSILFLSAYTPLGVITSLLVWTQSRIAAGIVAGAVVLSLLALGLFIRDLKTNSEPVLLPVDQIQQRDGELVSYVVTYALPFLAIPFESVRVSVGLTIFFLVIWYMQVKLNLLHINPILAVFNYHLYDVTTNGSVQILLSKEDRIAVDVINVVRAGNGSVLFEVDRE